MININGINLDKEFIFSGGEVQIRLPDLGSFDKWGVIRVNCVLNSSDEIMKMLMVSDAIEREFQGTQMVIFNIGYLPYARQDRACYKGEAFGAEMMGKILGLLKYDNLNVVDVHSPEAFNTLPENTYYRTSLDVIKAKVDMSPYDAIVCPDGGAYEKTKAIADYFELPLIRCEKVRDPRNGWITDFNIVDNIDKISGNRLLVVDDICDGGKTFEMLADAVRMFNPTSLDLYVTHGIFSKGVKPLYDAGYDKLITTDSFYQGEDRKLLQVIKL